MALLQWFTRPRNADEGVPSEGGHEIEGVPASVKSERTARRELLYAVVRESMLKAGVLSAQYRFKVLSLDRRGRKSLLMIDLDTALAGGPAQLGRIERGIAEAARTRHDLAVKAVYWRQNAAAATAVPAGAARPATEPAATAAAASAAADPIQQEVAAFRAAVADGAPRPAARAFDGQAVHGPQSYTLLTGFEDTELREERQAADLGTLPPGEQR